MKIELGKEEIIKYTYKCDICGKETSYPRKCRICGIDTCSDCTKFDPRDIGDYTTKYCIRCFKIGEKYLEQITVEEQKFDTIVEEIERKWKDEAIKNKEQSVIRI